MIRVAYLCEPHVGGMYSFFLKMRPALQERGFDFRCVCPFPRHLYEGSRYQDEEGVDYLDLPDDPASSTARILQHLQQNEYRIVVVLPGCYEVATNLSRYLPVSIRCLARLPHGARGVYFPTQFLSPHLDGIVAVSDRLKRDLVSDYGIEEKQISIIYNGIAIDPDCALNERRAGEPCSLLFVGRLEDLQKNVLLLPPLLRRLSRMGVAIRLTIVGDGPDRQELVDRIARMNLFSKVHMAGELRPAEMREVWQDAHVFLLPSRFEGCPNALLEAMQVGCVPVVSALQGISDVFVEDGRSGILCPVGSVRSFADAVARLAQDETVRRRMALAARAQVQQHFSLERMVGSYVSLFGRVLKSDSHRAAPLPLGQFRMPPVLGPTWRRYVPRPVKKVVRTMMERAGRSV